MNRPDISTNTHVQIDQFIDLCVLPDTFHELFCIFGDFYADVDAECRGNKITVLQQTAKNNCRGWGGGGGLRASSQLGKSDINHKKPT